MKIRLLWLRIKDYVQQIKVRVNLLRIARNDTRIKPRESRSYHILQYRIGRTTIGYILCKDSADSLDLRNKLGLVGFASALWIYETLDWNALIASKREDNSINYSPFWGEKRYMDTLPDLIRSRFILVYIRNKHEDD